MRKMQTVVTQQEGSLSRGLEKLGIKVTAAPLLTFQGLTYSFPPRAPEALAVTSRRTLTFLGCNGRQQLIRYSQNGTLFFAVGRKTENGLGEIGIGTHIPAAPNAQSLSESVAHLFPRPADRHGIFWWLPGSEKAHKTLLYALTELEFPARATPVYTPRPVAALPCAYRNADCVIVTSGSAGRALAGFLNSEFRAPGVIALGAQTARDCTDAGLHVAALADTPDAAGIARALRSLSQN